MAAPTTDTIHTTGATAIEAFVHARRVNGEQRFGAGLVPLSDGVAVRVTLR